MSTHAQDSSNANLAKERWHRKTRLAATFRIFARFGYDEGVAGHVTARDPIETDTFWVNPFGRHFGTIRASDLIRVNHHGVVVEGQGLLNQAAFAIHSAVHRARPDALAAAHTHSMYGKTWSTLGRRLDPISQDSCAFYEDHGLLDHYSGVVLDAEEGQRITQALGHTKGLILRNHGLLTVGHTVEETAWWFIAMDRSCHSQLLAESAGTPIMIEPHYAQLTHDQVGTPLAGWFSFQPLWEYIIHKEPDLID